MPRLSASAAWLLAFAATSASAKNATGINLQLYAPTPSGVGFFTTESGEVNAHLALSAGGALVYGRKILQVEARPPVGQSGTAVQDVSIVGNRIDLNLMASVGLWGRAELGLVFPLVFENGFDMVGLQNLGSVAGTLNLGTITQSGLRTLTQGDLRVVPKVNIFNMDEGTLALAAVLTFTVPTSSGAPFAGEAGPTFAPSLALSTSAGALRAAVNAGFRLRKSQDVLTTVFGNEYFFKAAAALNLRPDKPVPLELVGEIFGSTQVSHPWGIGTSGADALYAQAGSPLEADVGLRLTTGTIITTVGGGGGLRPGYGAPAPRVFVSATWYSGKTILPDRDGDGVPDQSDKCPDRPEDKDGFEDDDGCPDLDNDKDGIADEDDQCPNEAEDKDGYQDDDGCPDPDNDSDGIPDEKDKCPGEPEDKDGFEDEDGCPDLDNDKDKFPDALDRCPDDAEDIDNFEDDDGCPDLDNDGDGLPDLNDLCPNVPEDKDGVKDDDGCPEDNDNDGLADDIDKCPNEPETYNGFKDDDGCPDTTEKKTLVKVTEDKIEIKEAVFFKTGSNVVAQRSFDMLNQVVAVLKNFKSIGLLKVEGHTDNAGPRSKNIKLSQGRADAVRQYLVSHGVEAHRLEARGVGPERPIASNKTAAGREQNRRVEFIIMTQKALGQEVKPTPLAAPPSMPAPGAIVPQKNETPATDNQEEIKMDLSNPNGTPTVAPSGEAPLFEVPPTPGAPSKKGKGKKVRKKREAVEFNF